MGRQVRMYRCAWIRRYSTQVNECSDPWLIMAQINEFNRYSVPLLAQEQVHMSF